MTTPSSTKSLLYVSVDEEQAARISDGLQVRGGFDVRHARTVADALERIEAASDLVCILSDTRLPDGDWRTLLEGVRSSFPTLPFILYPRPDDEPCLEAAFEAGVTGYLHQGSGTAHLTDLCAAIQAGIHADRTTESLSERQKELQTIQAITTIIDTGDRSFRAMLYSVVRVIPDSFQWPDRTHARLVVDDIIVETDGFALGDEYAAVRTTTTSDVDIFLTVAVESGTTDGDATILAEERAFLETVITLLSGEVERRTYVERLEEVENRFHQITENISEVVWITDAAQSELVYVNPAYESVWGQSTESLYADPTSFLESVHADDRDRVERAVFAQQHGAYDEEYRIVLPNGELRWIHDRGVPVENEDGTVYRVVGLSEDVTDRKEREQQLAVLDRVLRHNLRNDMNIIIGNAEEITRKENAGTVAHSQAIIQVAEELLDLAEKQRHLFRLLNTPREPLTQDIETVLEEIRKPVATANPTATIDVFLTADRTGPIRTTPHLDIAISELVENAIEHGSSDEPTVAIDAAVTESGIDIRVSDDGPGIPLEEQAVLESEESQLFHGSGMGLWLVHWIVTQAGGSVSFEPNDGRGTAVTLWVPHVPSAA